jgi:hypothetical protein
MVLANGSHHWRAHWPAMLSNQARRQGFSLIPHPASQHARQGSGLVLRTRNDSTKLWVYAQVLVKVSGSENTRQS